MTFPLFVCLYNRTQSFQLSYYPHRLEQFSALLKETFGENSRHRLFGDFLPIEQLEKGTDPAYYIHVIEK